MNLALVLYHRCNLRCRYCYTGRKFDRAMSLDVARKAVDFGLAHSTTGHLTLSFFGGEPLLEIEAMQAVVSYAERRAQETSHSLAFSISTNGTLLDEHRLSLLRDHAFHVQVSIDGAAAAQNLTRPYEDGRPSHDHVTANLRRLVAENLLEQIVAVIDPTTAAWLRDSYGTLPASARPRSTSRPTTSATGTMRPAPTSRWRCVSWATRILKLFAKVDCCASTRCTEKSSRI